MTVSYRPTQDQDPQEPGSQHNQRSPGDGLRDGAGQQPAPLIAPPGVGEPIRRRVVVKPPVTPLPGTRFFGPEQNGQHVPAVRPSSVNQVSTSGSGGSPLNAPQPAIEHVPTRALPALPNNRQQFEQARTVSLPGVSYPGNGSHGGSGNSGNSGAGTSREPASVRNAPGVGFMSNSVSPAEMAQHGPKLEIENGNIILYRTNNFFLRTAYRPGQRPNPLRKPTGHTTVMPRVLPNQDKRMAASETRLMPSVTVNTTKQTRAIPLPVWAEAILVAISLMGVLVAHVYNMFNFPRFELDEGTYMANAWAITKGMLSPYSYGYGHPPLGWIQIAGWLQLTGGPFTFGNAINSGRVFMLLYAVGSALLMYLIVRRMTGSRSAGLLALVIFSFSPLSITYQRQVFLDNIATFWLLVSLYLLVASNSRLKYIVGAGLAFGIAVLSKETILVCFPALIYAAWLSSTKFQRKFSMVAFVYAVIAVGSTFVLLALLKGELFPYTWHLPWDHHDHLSLIATYIGQAQRSESNGSFAGSWLIWIENDPALIVVSLVSPAFNLIYGWWNRKHLMVALLLISYWALLARGGQTLSFYIIPVIPMAALNVALAVNTILSWLVKVVRFDVVRAVLLFGAIAVVLPYDIKETGFRFYQHPTSAQEQAIVWIRENVPHNDFIVINSYPYLDLRLPGGEGVGDGSPYPHAEVYWNVAYDPVLHDNTLMGNPDRIDYIVADSEMLSDFKSFPKDNIIKQAMQHVVLRAQFSADDHSDQIVINIYQVIHKFAPATVMSGQQGGTGATALNISASPRGDPVAINERKWYAPMS